MKNALYDQSTDGRKMTTRLKKGVEVVLVTPMGTPTVLYKMIFGKPVVKAVEWGMCRKTGISNFRWIPFSGVDKPSLEQRQELLAKLVL